MRSGSTIVLSATLMLSGCAKPASRPEPIPRAHIKPPQRPAIPLDRQRGALRDAYRLRPDGRFLLAFGELARLAAAVPAAAGTPATAAFVGEKWIVRLDGKDVCSLPELPDFNDYFAPLVSRAKSAVGKKSRSGGVPRDVESGPFLMPGLLDEIRNAERSWNDGSSPLLAARAFSRMAFQMSDHLEIAPLIPARALAILAAVRARDAKAGVDEEILLAQTLGYTRHAEELARTLPPGSALRLFEGRDTALREAASKPGASEESRYLALRSATDEGDLGRWKAARALFFPDNGSAAVLATGLELELPEQLEVSDQRDLLASALPRAVLRELGGPGTESVDTNADLAPLFETTLRSAPADAHGLLWDGPALTAYAEAGYYSSIRGVDRWPAWAMTARSHELFQRFLQDKPTATDPTREESGAGAPLAIQGTRSRIERGQLRYPQTASEIRALVRGLDSRPSHRAALAGFLHYNLMDIAAAEDLHRSLLQILGDGDPKSKATSALYLGDWATLERLIQSPRLTPPVAWSILSSWTGLGTEPDRLDQEYRRLITKFPNDWNVPSLYLGYLRSQEKYREGSAMLERWLERNADPRTPGHFHAHVRLAHNYFLEHEFEKGRALLAAMNVSDRYQQAIINRGIAECLAGQGKLAESESLTRAALRVRYWDSEDIRDLVRVLWAQGKDKEAAGILAGRDHRLSEPQICACLTDDLPDVFRELPAERLSHAMEAIAKEPSLANYYRCAPKGFAKEKNWEDALRVSSTFSPTGDAGTDQLIVRYEYMKSWKGRDAAAQWLKSQIPPGHLNPLSMKATYAKDDDLLWDVIVTPEPNDHPEWVWLLRACGFALRGGGTERREALLAYYGKTDPDPYHVMGRHLLGLASEAEMSTLVTTPQRLTEVAYYLGARAQSERRFRDACEWFRVSGESPAQSGAGSLALWALSDFAHTPQGIWKLESEAPPEPAAAKPAASRKSRTAEAARPSR